MGWKKKNKKTMMFISRVSGVRARFGDPAKGRFLDFEDDFRFEISLVEATFTRTRFRFDTVSRL